MITNPVGVFISVVVGCLLVIFFMKAVEYWERKFSEPPLTKYGAVVQ